MLDPAAELAIRIQVDDKENTLTISDTGIGMTAEELIENLGTIARSGAREFIQAAQEAEAQGESRKITDLIGQFGVGFYSAFMVAEWIRVTSRSYRPDAQAATWYCNRQRYLHGRTGRESRARDHGGGEAERRRQRVHPGVPPA